MYVTIRVVLDRDDRGAFSGDLGSSCDVSGIDLRLVPDETAQAVTRLWRGQCIATLNALPRIICSIFLLQ